MLSLSALFFALAFASPASALEASGANAPDAVFSVTSSPARGLLTDYYVQRDIAGMRRLNREARTRGERLLVRYRLFPMTMDLNVIGQIPSDEGVTSAREMALIAAMWAYRAGNGPKINLPTHGRRSERILNQAKDINPHEPYVLLVEGQSYLYKPGIFGGDAGKAKEKFQALKRVLGRREVPGIHPFEADVWIWMAERKLDSRRANTMKRQLLARNPPPMFRQFLIDPP